MEDFASSAMMRVIASGLRRLGIDIPIASTDRAHVALDTKRTVLATIAARHGQAILLRLGQGIRDLPEEPLLVALRAARDPRDLMQRWQRLERFAHSRHRIEQVEVGAHCLRWTHKSIEPGASPSTEEHLIVFGVLIELLALIGVDGVYFRFSETGEWLDAQIRDIDDTSFDDTATLELKWKPIAATAYEHPTVHGYSSEVRRHIERDVCNEWTIAEISQSIGTSPRTLQRKLASEGTSFGALLRAARLNHASRLLVHSERGMAEVGYLCGFSDQAHFTREMKRATAMTPGQFRNATMIQAQRANVH
jgi:AraC-like DNA-binding protein